MALAAATVWEVRTTGNNANGGGFVAGASGTDRSQQAAAQIAYTDLVLATTTTLTSAAFPFSAAEVGNILNITGGTGFTTGWYQIVSVSVVTATIDRVGGTGGSTGGTGNLGGALLTIAQALTLAIVDSMTIYVRGGTYIITTALSFPGQSGTAHTSLLGYSTTRGDLGRPIVSVTAAVNGATLNTGWSIENFEFDGTNTGVVGFATANGIVNVSNVKIHRFTGAGASGNGANLTFDYCEVTACASGLTLGSSGVVSRSWIHDNTGNGISIDNNGSVTHCVVSNNTGGSSVGITIASSGAATLLSNVIYGNGSHGISTVTAALVRGALVARNNIVMSNGGYGWDQVSVIARPDFPWIDYNAFYNNTSGARNNVNASPNDVTLTADPFTNAAGNDFTLNNTSGGGAACRGAGSPGVLPGL
jgi:hypothetical protein